MFCGWRKELTLFMIRVPLSKVPRAALSGTCIYSHSKPSWHADLSSRWTVCITPKWQGDAGQGRDQKSHFRYKAVSKHCLFQSLLVTHLAGIAATSFRMKVSCTLANTQAISVLILICGSATRGRYDLPCLPTRWTVVYSVLTNKEVGSWVSVPLTLWPGLTSHLHPCWSVLFSECPLGLLNTGFLWCSPKGIWLSCVRPFKDGHSLVLGFWQLWCQLDYI